jgi:hypothetical protein
MAATAILYFVNTFHSTYLGHNTLRELPGVQIWWKSVKRFKSYSTLCKFKMAATAILYFSENVLFDLPGAWYVTGATWRSNLVKIGQTVQKLQHFM